MAATWTWARSHPRPTRPGGIRLSLDDVRLNTMIEVGCFVLLTCWSLMLDAGRRRCLFCLLGTGTMKKFFYSSMNRMTACFMLPNILVLVLSSSNANNIGDL